VLPRGQRDPARLHPVLEHRSVQRRPIHPQRVPAVPDRPAVPWRC
jgi:hypothetical protein